MIDFHSIHDAMMELEDQSDDPRDDVPVGEVAAKLLGIEHTEELDEFLVTEARRVVSLFDGHYARVGVQRNVGNVAALGLVQGISIAAAVQKVKAGEHE